MQQWHAESRSYGRDTTIQCHSQPVEESAPGREGGAVHEERLGGEGDGETELAEYGKIL